MAVYAQIAKDKVVEIFSPPNGMTIEQCFHSSLVWVDITGRYPEPQAGWDAVFSGGIWTITPPVTPDLTPAQQAQAALGSGVQIASFSNPSLNATYPIDAESRINIMAEMISLSTNGIFTNGAEVIDWLDVNARTHLFDADHFRSYAMAIGIYVTALKQIIGGVITTLPSQPVRII